MRQWRVMDVGSHCTYMISLGPSACPQHPVSPVVPCLLLFMSLPEVTVLSLRSLGTAGGPSRQPC